MGDNKISEAAVEAARRSLYFSASPEATEAEYIEDRLQDESAEDVTAWARAALEAALPHLQGEAVPVANGKLVAWWNGITPGYDGQGDWSIRWGADAENSRHDIPLYDGYNPIHYRQPAEQSDVFNEALAVGDGTVNGAVVYWHQRALAAEAKLSEVSGTSGELSPPDEKLLRFYDVSTYPQLVEALEEHVMKLLDLRKRNVKPWEDTFPPTLLPKHERDQHPVFAKDLLALADKWQDAAAETWGEGPVNSTKQDCCDELRDVVSASIYASSALATTGKQQVGEVEGDAR